MMIGKSVCIAFLFFSICSALNGQTPQSLLNDRIDDDYERLASILTTPLFDKEEIKARRIKNCTIKLNVPKHTYNKRGFTDSVAVFQFDEEGNIIFSLTNRGRVYDKSIIWDTIIGRYERVWPGYRRDTLISNRNAQKIVTIYCFAPLAPDYSVSDTSDILKEIYDEKNRLIETSNEIPRDYLIYLCRVACCNQEQNHYFYRYDKHNNLIYFHNNYNITYIKIRYRPSERIVYTYDAQTNKLNNTRNIAYINNGDSIFEKLRPAITLYRLEKNSRLFRSMKKDMSYIDMGLHEYVFHYTYWQQKEITIPDPKSIITK